jgi:CHAD domain-containing protein
MQTRDQPLAPVLRLSTQRTEHHLVTGEQALADIADDRVTATRLSAEDGEPVAEQTWRELEVELVHGDRRLLKRVDRQLRRWGATRSASSSKLVRGLGIEPELGQARQAIKRRQRRLTARSTAGEVIVAYLAGEVERIREQDLLVRLDLPDSLHTMRVATRRVRSALHTYGSLFEADRVEPLEPELKWLAAELGHARDAEVLRMRLLSAVGAEQARHLSTAQVTRTVDREMAREQKAAFATVTATLDSDRYRQLVTALEELLTAPPLTGKASKPAGNQLPRLVAKTYEEVRHSVLAGSALPSGDERDAQLHEARKAAKRARYAAEAATPAFGKSAKAFAGAMELLQEVLGERHDSVALQQRLHALALEASPPLAFTYGRLHARESAHQDRVDASVPQAWKAAAKKSLRTWLA